MTGTSTSATMAGTARAASSVLTVTRTSSLPAACSARTCAAVAAASAVSVLVMDWTTIGCALPTKTPPTLTVMVGRRVLTGTKYSAGATPASLEDFVVQNDADVHVRQTHPPSHRGTHIGADSGANAYPEGIGVKDAIRQRDLVGPQEHGIGADQMAGRVADVRRSNEETALLLREEDLEG